MVADHWKMLSIIPTLQTQCFELCSCFVYKVQFKGNNTITQPLICNKQVPPV